jgi:hypothetical protein
MADQNRLRMLATLLKQPLPMEGRFNVLPIREQVPGMGPSLFNKRELALPGLLAGAVNAATAPGRAAGGLLADPKQEAANFAGTFMGGGLLGSGLAGGVPRGSIGMNAYHGTSHKFDAFDLNKIGTGEGAQAYGHGLYFAESKAVAGQYQKQLSGDVFSVGDGTTFDPSTLGHMSLRVVTRKGDLDAAIAKAKEIASSDSQSAHIAANDLKALEGLKSRGGIAPHKGHLYNVDIPDEAVGKMLDWDAPIAQQPEAARKLLAAVQAQRAAADAAKGYSTLKVTDIRRDSQGQPLNEMSGGQLYNYLASARYGGSQVKATEALRAAGIPGIRYLDQASRSAGRGTRNLVLFDDKLARITKRE